MYHKCFGNLKLVAGERAAVQRAVCGVVVKRTGLSGAGFYR